MYPLALSAPDFDAGSSSIPIKNLKKSKESSNLSNEKILANLLGPNPNQKRPFQVK